MQTVRDIADNVHGRIALTQLACDVIDTPEFQRLRSLRQLGVCYFVFPNAVHTRFEHSLGTYQLAGRILTQIKKNSDVDEINSGLREVKELEQYYAKNNSTDLLDPYVQELVKIAALCHDIGHGPFSHVFDDIIIPQLRTKISPSDTHEERSCQLVAKIAQNIITPDEIQFICNLINPQKHHTGFIYQIVSNSVNNVDVDKCDYIARDSLNLNMKFGFNFDRIIDDAKVIDNNICYNLKMYFELVDLFTTRYKLHKQVYSHPTIIGIQHMIQKIMILLDPLIGFYSSTFDLDRFCEMTDEYVIIMTKHYYRNRHEYPEHIDNITDAYKTLQLLLNRQLYKYIGTIVSAEKIICTPETIDIEHADKIFVYTSKIGLVSGNKSNPFEKILFYRKKQPDKCFIAPADSQSYLMPHNHQEYIAMIFVMDGGIVDLVTETMKLLLADF